MVGWMQKLTGKTKERQIRKMKKAFVILLALAMLLTMVSTGMAGKEEEEYCKANGHTPVVDPAVDPTCTETGLTQGSHCSVCKAVLTRQEVIPALDHLFIAWYPNGRQTHLMICKRKCGYQDVQYCTMMPLPQADPDAESVYFCPICGTCTAAENMAAVKGLKIVSGAPKGSLRVFSLPLSGAKYMTVAFEYSGDLVQPAGEVTFTLPEELKDASFVRVDGEGTELLLESAEEPGTLKLNFAPEGEDPVKVILLKEI